MKLTGVRFHSCTHILIMGMLPANTTGRLIGHAPGHLWVLDTKAHCKGLGRQAHAFSRQLLKQRAAAVASRQHDRTGTLVATTWSNQASPLCGHIELGILDGALERAA